MKGLTRRTYLSVVHSRWFKYFVLALFPWFARPLDFIDEASRPNYTRFPGLWVYPFISAGVLARANARLLSWSFHQNLHELGESPSISGWRSIGHAQTISYWVVVAATVIMIYGVATIRWTYHWSAVRVVQWLRMPACVAPLKFFVVHTAAWGLWFGILAYGIASLFWASDGQPATFVAREQVVHPCLTMVVLVLIGVALQLADRNRMRGMKALYGGSTFMLVLVDLLAVGLLLGLVYAISYVA